MGAEVPGRDAFFNLEVKISARLRHEHALSFCYFFLFIYMGGRTE
jgi:hypothetical protein